MAFKCSTQKQATNLKQGRLAKSRKGGKSTDSASVSGAFTGSDSLGAETLLQLLKNYARNADIKTAITVGQSPRLQAATLTKCNCDHQRKISLCMPRSGTAAIANAVVWSFLVPGTFEGTYHAGLSSSRK